MNNFTRNSSIAIIIGVGAFLRAHNLTAVWAGKHNAWGGAMYGGIARNTIKYGWWTTGFGPVANNGRVSPDMFEYYYHYPPLLNWLLSVAFSVFGVHEWSARLVPVVFSIALMIVIYLLARRLFSGAVAIIALLLSAVMPIEAYYGGHVDVYNSLAVFFTALAVYGYARWIDSARNRDLVLWLGAVVLGCMSAWFTFFLVPLIVVHYLFLQGQPRRPVDRRIWLAPIAAVVVFALFMLHRHFLMTGGQAELMGGLFDKLKMRTSLETPAGQNADVLGLAFRHKADLSRLYSAPLMLLSASWLVFFGADAFRHRLQPRDWMVMMLFGYGFLHNLIFPSLLHGHDYMVVCYVPAIAIAAAVVVTRLGVIVERTWGKLPQTAALAAMVFFTIATEVSDTRALYRDELQNGDLARGDLIKRWGMALRRQTRDTDLVLMCSEDDRVLGYYAERELRFSIVTATQLQAALRQRAARLFACPEADAPKYQELAAYLNRSYPQGKADGMLLYDLSQ